MKKLKLIENPKMDLHPQHELTPEEMAHIQGGWGCICDARAFNTNDGCICNKNKFGLCSEVNGGGPGPGNGCPCTSWIPPEVTKPKIETLEPESPKIDSLVMG